MAERVIIGGKSYDAAYANDPRNQEEIRLAVVNGGNDIYTTKGGNLIQNTTGDMINANSTGRVTSTGSTYKNAYGQDITPYSERNSIGTVAAGTIFDPNSSNFNSLIANSGGRINLQNQGDYNSQGMFTGANSGTANEAEMKAYYANLGRNTDNIASGGSAISGSGSYRNNTLLSNNSYGNTANYSGTNYNGTNDVTANINSLKEFQKQAAIAGLTKARDTSLSNLAADKEKIAPAYYNQRADTSTSSQLGAKNLAEYLAARGQTSAGVAGQSELNRNNQLQGDIGKLKIAEQGAFNDNARSVTNLNNAFESDVASSNAGIEATGMQNLINAQQQARVEALAQANADRAYNYQLSRDAVNDTNYNNQFAYNQSRDVVNDTGYLNGQLTLQGQQSAAQIAASNANTAGQLIQNTYAGQIAQGQIDANKASLVYQNLVNSGYSKEESLKLGGMLASYNGQNLQNNYQSLVNQGYGQEQALKIATMASQLTGQNLSNTAQSIQNQYMPSQLQASINKQNTSSSKTTSNGLKDSTSLGSAVNKAIAETNTVVNNNEYNFDDRLTILNNMLKNYSSSAGNEAKYMVDYVTKAIAQVAQQKKDYVNSGRYEGM